jgi:hypothetical protein
MFDGKEIAMSKRTGTRPSEGKTPERDSLNRRRFFMLGGSAAAAATVPLVTEAQAAVESDADQKKARYRETDHVKTFYRVNRY